MHSPSFNANNVLQKQRNNWRIALSSSKALTAISHCLTLIIIFALQWFLTVEQLHFVWFVCPTILSLNVKCSPVWNDDKDAHRVKIQGEAKGCFCQKICVVGLWSCKKFREVHPFYVLTQLINICFDNFQWGSCFITPYSPVFICACVEWCKSETENGALVGTNDAWKYTESYHNGHATQSFTRNKSSSILISASSNYFCSHFDML